MKPKGIVVHHTVGSETATVDEIDRYHRVARGFSMIGYHHLIRCARYGWQPEEGRPERYRGAHCRGKQDHLGVAVAGNYEEAQISDEALNCLIDFLAELCVSHGFTVNDITYHQQHKKKTQCPGRYIIARWTDILEEVAARLPTPSPQRKEGLVA